MATQTISVKFGRLIEPIKVMKVDAGTTLCQFLKANDIQYGPAICVNGEEVSSAHVLQEGDIIVEADRIEGGR